MPSRNTNYLRITLDLIKALANVYILLQILIGSLEPVQFQNKCNPKQTGKKAKQKISKLREVGEQLQTFSELKSIC